VVIGEWKMEKGEWALVKMVDEGLIWLNVV